MLLSELLLICGESRIPMVMAITIRKRLFLKALAFILVLEDTECPVLPKDQMGKFTGESGILVSTPKCPTERIINTQTKA